MIQYQPGLKLSDVERVWIIGALQYHQGNRTKAAESLGLSIKTIYNKIGEYGIEIPPKGAVSEEERVLQIAAAASVEPNSEITPELPVPVRQRKEVQKVLSEQNAAHASIRGSKKGTA